MIYEDAEMPDAAVHANFGGSTWQLAERTATERTATGAAAAPAASADNRPECVGCHQPIPHMAEFHGVRCTICCPTCASFFGKKSMLYPKEAQRLVGDAKEGPLNAIISSKRVHHSRNMFITAEVYHTALSRTTGGGGGGSSTVSQTPWQKAEMEKYAKKVLKNAAKLEKSKSDVPMRNNRAAKRALARSVRLEWLKSQLLESRMWQHRRLLYVRGDASVDPSMMWSSIEAMLAAPSRSARCGPPPARAPSSAGAAAAAGGGGKQEPPSSPDSAPPPPPPAAAAGSSSSPAAAGHRQCSAAVAMTKEYGDAVLRDFLSASALRPSWSKVLVAAALVTWADTEALFLRFDAALAKRRARSQAVAAVEGAAAGGGRGGTGGAVVAGGGQGAGAGAGGGATGQSAAEGAGAGTGVFQADMGEGMATPASAPIVAVAAAAAAQPQAMQQLVIQQQGKILCASMLEATGGKGKTEGCPRNCGFCSSSSSSSSSAPSPGGDAGSGSGGSSVAAAAAAPVVSRTWRLHFLRWLIKKLPRELGVVAAVGKKGKGGGWAAAALAEKVAMPPGATVTAQHLKAFVEWQELFRSVYEAETLTGKLIEDLVPGVHARFRG